MFSKTPIELLSKDFSNIYNKCHAIHELIISRKYNESLALLTASEIYSIAEKAYLRCDTFPELQTKEVEKVNKIYKNTLFSPLWNNLLEVYFLAVLKIDINLHHE